MIFNISKKDILPLIESALIKPDILEPELIKLCEDAKQYSFSGIYVHPIHIKFCKKLLKNTPYKINVNTFVSYPYGGDTISVKAKAIKNAFKEGAAHVDVVVNIAAIKAGRWDLYQKEVEKLVKVGGTTRGVKIVLCTEFLTREEINKACELAVAAKARFIRNTTECFEGEIDYEVISFMDDCITHWLRTRGDDMKPCLLCVSGAKTYEDSLKLASVKAQRISTQNAAKIAEAGELVKAQWSKTEPQIKLETVPLDELISIKNTNEIEQDEQQEAEIEQEEIQTKEEEEE